MQEKQPKPGAALANAGRSGIRLGRVEKRVRSASLQAGRPLSSGFAAARRAARSGAEGRTAAPARHSLMNSVAPAPAPEPAPPGGSRRSPRTSPRREPVEPSFFVCQVHLLARQECVGTGGAEGRCYLICDHLAMPNRLHKFLHHS